MLDIGDPAAERCERLIHLIGAPRNDMAAGSSLAGGDKWALVFYCSGGGGYLGVCFLAVRDDVFGFLPVFCW